MVNKKTLADMSARMNINTGAAMSIFRHNPRYEMNVLVIKLMCDPINHDCPDARIAEDDFIIAFGRRITIVSGANIFCQHRS